MKKLSSSLAIVLSVLLLIASLPMAAFAGTVAGEYTLVFEGNADSEIVNGDKEIVVAANSNITPDDSYLKVPANATNSYVKFAAEAPDGITYYAVFVDALAATEDVNVSPNFYDAEGVAIEYAFDEAWTISTVDTSEDFPEAVNGAITIPAGFAGYVLFPADFAAAGLGITASADIYFDDIYAVVKEDNFYLDCTDPVVFGSLLVGSDDITVSYSKEAKTVSWTAVENAETYWVYLCTDDSVTLKKKGANELSATYDEIAYAGGDAEVQVMAIGGDALDYAVLGISKATTIEYGEVAPYAVLNAGGDKSTLVNGAKINTNWTALNAVAGTNLNSPTNVLNFVYPGSAFPSNNSTFIQSTMSYGFKMDNSCFTNAVIPASKVQSIAVYVDFSKTSVAEAWRVIAVKNTATNLTANNNQTVASVRASEDTRGYTIPVFDTGMDVHMHNTESTATVSDTSSINVDATLINVKTGEISSLAVTGSDTNVYGAQGGYCIPAGFVGYVCFNFDLPENARYLSDIGYINLVRKGIVGENVAKREDATTYPGFSIWPDNYNDPYAIGAWYAVTDIDTFAADIFAGEFGATGHGTCSAEATDGDTTSVTWTEVEGAVSYKANIFNASTKALLASKTVDATSVDMGVLYTDYIFNVVAYNADGEVVAVLGDHIYERVIEIHASTTQRGYEYDQCVVCGNKANEHRPPVLGVISNINSLNGSNMQSYNTSDNTTLNVTVAEGIWGASNVKLASIGGNKTYASQGTLGWGPSLYFAQAVLYNGNNSSGIAVAHTLTSAQGLGFYIDLAYTKSLSQENLYFDIAFSDSSIVNTNTHEYWTWIVGSYLCDIDTSKKQYQQQDYFTDDNPVKLYNIDTGAYTNAVLDYQGTKENEAGFAIPRGFRGYVILDLSSYNGEAMSLADVNAIRVDLHKGRNDVYVDEAQSILKYVNLKNTVVFDNFFNINDMASFSNDKEGYISEVGIFAPDSGVNLYASYTDVDKIKLTTTKMDDATDVAYNIYRLDSNNDGYVLVKTSDVDTVSVADLSAGEYYIQAVGKLSGKVVASELLAYTPPAPCAHESFTETVVPPTATEKGYKVMVCDAGCGYSYVVEGSYVDPLGVIFNINSLGAHNLEANEDDSNANVTVAEGIWGESNYTKSKTSGCNYTATGLKWGPSLGYANVQIWNSTASAGITVTHTLASAQAFGFYMDLSATSSYQGDNVYFDIAFSNSSVVNTNINTDWKWILGSVQYNYNEYQQRNYFSDAYPVKLYNVDTGEYTNAVLDFQDTLENEAGFAVPKGFRGYVILDLTSYNGAAMSLADVKSVKVDLHRHVNSVYVDESQTIYKYLNLAGGAIAFDNFFNINDIETFDEAPASYLNKFSVSPVINTNAAVDVEYADDATSASFTATGLGVTDGITYNLYTLSSDNDTYELVGTGTGANATINIEHDVKYYVQAVYVDATNKTVTATPLQLVRGTKEGDMSFGILRGQKEYTLLKYFGNDSTVVIPATAGGVGVVDIALDAFDETGANITELTTGNWVNNFKAGQFAALVNLEKVIYNTQNKPKSTATSAKPVFSAEGIEVVISQGVIRVPEYMFYDNKVASLTFAGDPTVEEIAKYAFYRNRIAGEIVIPDSVKVIGDAAFRGSLNATVITLGNAVESIGNWAFGYSEKVTAVKLNSGLKTIGFWAFGHDKALTEVVIPEGVTSIGRGAFGATAVSAVTIPYSVEYIGTDIFAEVTADATTVSVYNNSYAYIKANASGWTVNDLGTYYVLAAETDFTVQDVEGGVEIIAYTGAGGYIEVPATIGGKAVVGLGEKAFYVSGVANRTIEGIKLPASCTYIGYQAVRATLALKVIDAQGVSTVDDMAFLYSNVKSATFADGASVSDSAFEGCANIN